jgi:hypothetical protein
MTVWKHVGNVQSWSLTPKPTTIDHKNTQGPLKVVDLTAMTLFALDFSTKLDEFVPDNVLMALAGTSSASTAGQIISIGLAAVRRQMRFTGANQFGPQWEVILPNCFIAAKEEVVFLGSDEFASINLSGSVLFDQASGAFGTAQAIGQDTEVLNTPNILNYYLGTGSVFTAPLA